MLGPNRVRASEHLRRLSPPTYPAEEGSIVLQDVGLSNMCYTTSW